MDMYSALADPTRRTILELLAVKGQLPASDIYEEFNVSHPAISQHLKILRESRLVDMEKKAQQRIYRLNPHSIDQVDDWVQKIRKQWNERFDRLDALLSEDKKQLKKGRR